MAVLIKDGFGNVISPPMKSENENIVRFDMELTPEESKRLNEICLYTHRSRKNFSEALMKIVLRAKSDQINIAQLGFVCATEIK